MPAPALLTGPGPGGPVLVCLEMSLKPVPLRRLVLILLAFTALGMAASCAPRQAAPAADPPGQTAVDPVFREFYGLLGGKELLGPALAPAFEQDGRRCQYTTAVLLCFDPLARDIDRFSLAPLGEGLELPSAPADSLAAAFPEGIPVYPAFTELYERLQGERFAGRPLTAARINYLHGRVEQHFENAGFYLSLDRTEAGLLAYGAHACGEKCGSAPDDRMETVRLQGGSELEQPFAAALLESGDWRAFGQPLTQPYLAWDGYLEQIYENAALAAQPGQPESLSLRPLPALLLDLPETSLIPAEAQRGMVFVPVEGELGLLVPEVFDQYIEQNGGAGLSGPPVTPLWQLDSSLFRQCFTGYCLEYDHTAPRVEQVRMLSLGPAYLQAAGLDPSLITRHVYTPEMVEILLSEERGRVPPGETQRIEVQVQRRVDGLPLADVKTVLRVTLPGGEERAYALAPTGEDGRAAITLPGLELPVGSLIGYEACLSAPPAGPVCASDGYMIWE